MPAKRRPDCTFQPEPGDNARILHHELEVAALPKINTNDPEAVANRLREYFDICANNDMKPNIPGLALSLGIDRKTLWDWEAGRIHKPKEVTDMLKKARALLNGMLEDYAAEGKVNPVVSIFFAKNHHGYTDVQEHRVVANAVQAAESPELLVDGLKNLPE